MKFQSTLSVAAVIGVSSAHTIFTQLTSGGVQYGKSKDSEVLSVNIDNCQVSVKALEFHLMMV